MSTAVHMGSAVFGALLRARKETRLTQEDIAALIGVSRGHFNRIENGHKTASLDEVCRWCAALGVTLSVQTITRADDHAAS